MASNNYSDNYMELKTGSSIYFRSAERYDNIRGFTFDYAIIDEAAFIKQEAWTEAIRPTLVVRGKTYFSLENHQTIPTINHTQEVHTTHLLLLKKK